VWQECDFFFLQSMRLHNCTSSYGVNTIVIYIKARCQHENKYSYLVEILPDLQTVCFLTNVINVAIIIWMIIYLYTYYS